MQNRCSIRHDSTTDSAVQHSRVAVVVVLIPSAFESGNGGGSQRIAYRGFFAGASDCFALLGALHLAVGGGRLGVGFLSHCPVWFPFGWARFGYIV